MDQTETGHRATHFKPILYSLKLTVVFFFILIFENHYFFALTEVTYESQQLFP